MERFRKVPNLGVFLSCLLKHFCKVKILAVLVCFYFFVTALGLLDASFRLINGKGNHLLFSNRDLLQNPIVGLMIGVLSTVLLQSSSLTISIIVSMVASDVVKVHEGIPMMMGANVGTSVTNTIVSLSQIGDRDEFKRAFSGAVIHDVFNLITAVTLLVVEQIPPGFLFTVSNSIVSGMEKGALEEEPPEILKCLTKPLTDYIVQIDKKVLRGWSAYESNYANYTTTLLPYCSDIKDEDPTSNSLLLSALSTNRSSGDCAHNKYLLREVALSDLWWGIILLIASLVILFACLHGLIKLLNSLMEMEMTKCVSMQTTIRSRIPCSEWLIGYGAILIGFAMTLLLQSSSVFTSTLTPLVGTGLIRLENAYPLTVGSNLGTTTTALLAALTFDGDELRNSLQMAICHLLFNFIGLLLFYPVPFMRLPIPIAEALGRTVAYYRWFAIVYVLFVFILVPLYIFGLSMVSPVALYAGCLTPICFALVVAMINVIQRKKPRLLPRQVRNWEFLPEFLRSLDPYDRVIAKVNCCRNLGRE